MAWDTSRLTWGIEHDMADATKEDVLELTAQIVVAHVGHNQLSADTLPALIQSVFQALATVETPEAEPAAVQSPAVPIKKSVFPDFIVCLEDGKKLKMLKRHLKTSYNLTPEEYRAKWKLPVDYPMVAPSYASHRSDLAKRIGLGRIQPAEQSTENTAEIEQEPAANPLPKGRSRRKSSVAEAQE